MVHSLVQLTPQGSNPKSIKQGLIQEWAFRKKLKVKGWGTAEGNMILIKNASDDYPFKYTIWKKKKVDN